MKLRILVGSMTGTAEQVAQAIQLDCADLVTSIEVLPMDGLDIAVFGDAENPAEPTLHLVCTSTYGAGDVPDNAQALWQSLAQQPRYLGHVRYGVLALGDSSYPHTFCHGGQQFDERLQDLGARRLGEIGRHDASSGTLAEAEGAAWCRAWLQDALASA